MLLTLFSDFSCPYSYVTEAALRGFGIGGVTIDYRAFELFPEPELLLPVKIDDEERGTLERLAGFHGISLAGAGPRPRTRKAHEAARFARERGAEGELRDRLFAAYWEEGRDIGRVDVLMDVAAAAGIDPEELKIALDIDRFRDDVLHDEDVARRLRVPGTPTLFLGEGPRARVVTGAHGPAVLRTMIEEATRDPERSTDDV